MITIGLSGEHTRRRGGMKAYEGPSEASPGVGGIPPRLARFTSNCKPRARFARGKRYAVLKSRLRRLRDKRTSTLDMGVPMLRYRTAAAR
jgi:hypothetical protein